MKPIRLITPMLAIAAVVVISSCSGPRLAQKSSGNDDVYNSVAKAQEYVQPDPSQMAQYQDDQNYDDNYGTSDPNYDMDYSSRINRFYYGTPYRNYYDPYYGDFYSGLSPYSTGWSMGFGWGFGNYYNSIWNNPYYYGGWGGFYSPYYAYNPWGWGGGYYGGGWGGWGGGYWGGGWGGGYYGNRLPGNTTYGARPYRGSENGVGRPSRVISNGSYNGRGSTVTRNGVTYSDRSSRPQNYVPNRVNRGSADMGNRPSNPYVSPRPSRSDNYTPQRESRPSYTPPSNSGGGGYQGGGGGGGGSRSQRGGRN